MRDRHTAAGLSHLVMSMKPPVMVPFLLYWSPLMVTQFRWRASRATLPAVSRSLHTMILPKICRPASFYNNEEQKAEKLHMMRRFISKECGGRLKWP